MKYYISKILVLTILPFLTSCGNTNNYSEDLGSGYRFIHSGGGLRYISADNTVKNTHIYPTVIDYEFDNDYVLVAQQPVKEDYKAILSSYLGSNYSYYIKTKTDSVLSVDENPTEHASSILEDSLTYQDLAKRGLTQENSVSDMEIVNNYIDSIFLHNDYYKEIFSRKVNYWILHKSNDKLYGPFSWEEFEDKRQELRISTQLKKEK